MMMVVAVVVWCYMPTEGGLFAKTLSRIDLTSCLRESYQHSEKVSSQDRLMHDCLLLISKLQIQSEL